MKNTNVIRIFISSTFQDMQEERDYILNNIYPRLRTLAENNGLKLVFIDLRWGILNETEIITTCFREIDNSRPFFIGILGHRYGSCANYTDVMNNASIENEHSWLIDLLRQKQNNPENEISYTELEFLYGFLNETRENMRVLLLSKEPYSLDSKNIKNLKKKIIADGRYRIHPYSTKETLGEIIERSVEKLIDEIKPEVPVDGIDAAIYRQNIQIERYVSDFVKSKAYNKLLGLFQTKFPQNHLFLFGEDGCGKTAFLANLFNDVKNKTNALFCSLDFIPNPTCTQLASILDRLLSSLIGDENNDKDNLNNKPTIIDSFKEKQLLLSPQLNIYVFVDAIDKLKEADRFLLYGIIREAPSNIRYVLSYSHRDEVLKYIIPNKLQIIFPPYSEIEIENVISSYLPQYGKDMLSSKKNEIAQSVYSKNLFLLRLWLDDLLAFGDYKGLDSYITEVAQSEKEQEFLEKVFARFEKTLGYEMVASVLCTIAISPYGVNENDLISILNCPSNNLMRIIGAFRSLLIIQDDQYCISHSNFVRFIQERYKTVYLEVKEKVISYFEGKSIELPSKSSELNIKTLIELYYQNNILDKLAQLLLKPDVFCFVFKEDDTKLANYWNEISNSDSHYNIKSYLNCTVPNEYIEDFWNCLWEFYFNDMRNYDCALKAIDRLINDAPTETEALKRQINRVYINIEKQDYERAVSESLSLINEFIKIENDDELDLTERNRFIFEHFAVLHHLFLVCTDLKNIDLADSILGDAFDFLEKQKESIPEGKYYWMLFVQLLNLGKLFQEQGDIKAETNDSQKDTYYQKGIESYSMAGSIVEHKLKITSQTLLRIGNIYYNIGVLQTKLHHFEPACNAFSTANEILRRVSNSESLRMLAISYYNLALCESDLGELDKAIDSFSNSLSYTVVCMKQDPSYFPLQSLQCQYYIIKHKRTLNQVLNDAFIDHLGQILQECKELLPNYNLTGSELMIHIFDDIIENSNDEELVFNSFIEEVELIKGVLELNERIKSYSIFELHQKKYNLIIRMSFLFVSDNLKNIRVIKLLEDLLAKDCCSITDKIQRTQRVAEVNSRLGVLYRVNQDLEKSEFYLSKSFHDFESLHEFNAEQYANSFVGVCWEMMKLYEQNGDVKKYRFFVEKTLTYITPLLQNDMDTYRDCYVELICRKVIILVSTDTKEIDELVRMAENAYSLDNDSDMAKLALAIALNQKANSLLQMNELDEALDLVNRALYLCSSFPEIFETKGQILLALGDVEGSLKQWLSVIEIDPLYLEKHFDDCILYPQLVKLGYLQ